MWILNYQLLVFFGGSWWWVPWFLGPNFFESYYIRFLQLKKYALTLTVTKWTRNQPDIRPILLDRNKIDLPYSCFSSSIFSWAGTLNIQIQGIIWAWRISLPNSVTKYVMLIMQKGQPCNEIRQAHNAEGKTTWPTNWYYVVTHNADWCHVMARNTELGHVMAHNTELGYNALGLRRS